MRQRASLEAQLKALNELEQELADAVELIELAEAEEDESAAVDAEADLRRLARRKRADAQRRRCCQEKPTATTVSLKFMRALAEPRARIGQR